VKPYLDNAAFEGHFIPNPSTERGNNFHLGVDPKQPSKVAANVTTLHQSCCF
jgi:hypothetical protein